jgi:predicted phage tail protein
MAVRKIHLHGPVTDAFGGEFDLDVASVREAARALKANFGGAFHAYFGPRHWRVIVGDPATGWQLDEDDMGFLLGASAREIHFFEASPEELAAAREAPPAADGYVHLRGAKSGKSIGKLVVGVAILAVATAASFGAFGPVAAGFATPLASTGVLSGVTWGNIAVLGLALTLTGTAMLLSPAPRSPKPREKPDQRASFIFDGPVNLTEAGNPVPLVYGTVLTGGVVVAASLTVEQIR